MDYGTFRCQRYRPFLEECRIWHEAGCPDPAPGDLQSEWCQDGIDFAGDLTLDTDDFPPCPGCGGPSELVAVLVPLAG
jgi:hypothetical protein